MTRYLLDTNHFSAFWQSHPRMIERMAGHPRASFALALPSVGELWFMVFHSARVAANRSRLNRLLRDFNLYDFDRTAAVEFGKIKAQTYSSGTVLPDVDVQIAAIARAQSLILLTADAHFSYVGSLTTEDWTN